MFCRDLYHLNQKLKSSNFVEYENGSKYELTRPLIPSTSNNDNYEFCNSSPLLNWEFPMSHYICHLSFCILQAVSWWYWTKTLLSKNTTRQFGNKSSRQLYQFCVAIAIAHNTMRETRLRAAVCSLQLKYEVTVIMKSVL